MSKVTKRTRARKTNRDRRKQQEEANVSQILNMTPDKRSNENLAATTAIQRARAAAEQYDRRASDVNAETMAEWQRKGAARKSIVSEASFECNPPVTWTPEAGYVPTDDDEEYDEAAVQDAEASEAEAKNEDAAEDTESKEDAAAEEAADDAEASEATVEEAADGSSRIETPLAERPEATQSDLDFIVDDYDPNDETYVQTESDNDEEEEEIWTSY